MATIDQYEFPDDLYYTEQHVWARADGEIVTIGLSSFGQALAGDIVFVEIPLVGRQIKKEEAFMSMESGKWVGRVKAPVGGEITEANEELEWESTLVNEDPYGEGWLCRIQAADISELEDLMRTDSADFTDHIAAERKKYNK